MFLTESICFLQTSQALWDSTHAVQDNCIPLTCSLPQSTLVDLIFQSNSISLNRLTWRETCTAASVYLADVICILFSAYYAYNAI